MMKSFRFKTWIEVEVDIECEIQPHEPMTRDYPGCDREVLDLRLASPVELTTSQIAQLTEEVEIAIAAAEVFC